MGEKHNGYSRTDGRIMKMPLLCLCQYSFHKESLQSENFSSTKDLKPVESAFLWLGPDNSSVKLVDLELGHTLDSRRSLLLLTTSPRWGGGGGRLKEIGRKLRAWCCHGEFGQTQTGLGGWPEKPACLDNYTPKLLLVLPPSNTTKMAHSAVLV